MRKLWEKVKEAIRTLLKSLLMAGRAIGLI